MGSLGKFPAEMAGAVHVSAEAPPLKLILSGIREEPRTKDIIEVLPIETQVPTVLVKNAMQLMYCKIQSGIARGGRGSHGGTGKLYPPCVAELEHIAGHNNMQGRQDGSNGDVGAEFGTCEEALQLVKSVCSVNISVH